MKIITHDLNTNEDVHIIPLADLHVGDPHSDFKLIRETISRIANTENTFTVIGGDCMNSAIANSKSDFYGEVMPPQEQLKIVSGLFKLSAKSCVQ